MGNISNGMETICKDIVAGHEDRKKSLHDVKKDVEDIKEQAGNMRDNARKFMGDCKREHKEMAKNLEESLSLERQDLTKAVGSLKKDFHKSQKEVQADLAQACKAWSEMNKTLRGKKAK